jgi:hypothetical protein
LPANAQRVTSPGLDSNSRVEAREEQTIDIIGLEEVAGNVGTFRRLGRGRVICNGWLAGCTVKRVTII